MILIRNNWYLPVFPIFQWFSREIKVLVSSVDGCGDLWFAAFYCIFMEMQKVRDLRRNIDNDSCVDVLVMFPQAFKEYINNKIDIYSSVGLLVYFI